MAKSLRSVYTLFIGAVFIFLADGLYGIIIPINMELMGIPSNILGFVASAYYAGLIIGALTCRSIIIRFGHIRSFMMFMVFIALSAVISGAFPQPSVWFFMRFLCGLSQAGALILLDSWINDTVRGEYRGRVISSYMVTIYLSVAISQFMVSLAPPQNFTLFAIIAIFVCCAMVPLALTRSAPPTIKGSETMKVRKAFSISPVGIVGALCAGLVMGAFYGLAPVFAATAGMTTSQVGTFMGIAICGGIVFQMPMGKLADVIDKRLVIIIIALFIALAASAMVVTREISLTAMLIAAFFLGSATTLYPMSLAHAHSLMTSKQRIAASSRLLMTYATGAAIAPIIAGTLMSVAAPEALFIYMVFIALVLACFVAVRMIIRDPKEKKQIPYVPSSPKVPIVIEKHRNIPKN